MVEPWYAARCIFRSTSSLSAPNAFLYEERIVLIRANDFEDALKKAEREARVYASETDATEYLGYVDLFHLFEGVIGAGSEMFSLMRETKLDADEYIDRFFDTGTERRRQG